jgi:hypothetical protein
MELDLEEQWNKAFEAKRTGRIDAGRPVKGMELLWKVTNTSYVGTAAENWNERIVKTLKLEKAEAAKKYNIVFGQTEIYCARCKRPWGFGKHICSDIILKQLREEKNEKQEKLKPIKSNLLNILQHEIGVKKSSTLLEMSGNTVSNWINRRNIPTKHIEKVNKMIKSLHR